MRKNTQINKNVNQMNCIWKILKKQKPGHIFSNLKDKHESKRLKGDKRKRSKNKIKVFG